jgi:hypothetical protein
MSVFLFVKCIPQRKTYPKVNCRDMGNLRIKTADGLTYISLISLYLTYIYNTSVNNSEIIMK